MADKVDKSLTQGPRGSAIIPGEEQITEAITGALPGMLDSAMPELPSVTGGAVPGLPTPTPSVTGGALPF